MARLDGKVALVTGAASGIGAAIAAAYAREGARVIVADLALHQASAVAETLGNRAFGLAVDVRDEASIAAAVASAIAGAGRIDVLVNNAGVFGVQPWGSITAAEVERIFSVNVRGLLFMTQAVTRHMVAQGGGTIVNLASGAGRQGNPFSVVYSASKCAVISLTQSAALAFAKQGIRVNAIAPGGVLTPMWDRVDAEYGAALGQPKGSMTEAFAKSVPLGRMATPADYLGVAIFLASGESAYMTGQTVNVDGGLFLN